MGVLRAAAAEPCGLSELCARTGLPRATAHRLAVGLEVHGLLHRGADGRGGPGPRWPSSPHRGADPLLEAAAAVLPRLRDITGESVQLYRRDGTQRDLRRRGRAGQRAARHRAGRHAAADDGRLGRQGARRLGGSGHPAGAAAGGDVHRTGAARRAPPRWAQSVAEREAGVASVSAPVRDAGGQVVAAVSVSGPVDRIGRRPGVRWAADLLAAADALQHRL